MKRIWCIPLMVFCCGALLCGCSTGTTETITNRNIPIQDITEFYYTYENINFNAFYQRYHFYVDGDKYMFHHETREKPNGYGWTTEEDITESGTFELSPEEWRDFLGMLKDGTVSARTGSASSGSSGPWMYLYWKNDKGKYQEYAFTSVEARNGFEDYCNTLAHTER